MVKFRCLLFIGFIGLFLIGLIAVLSGPLKAGRKPKCEWGIKIIDQDDFGAYNLYGECSSRDGYYWDSNDNIYFQAKRGVRIGRNKDIYYYFRLFIYPNDNPNDNVDYVEFRNVYLQNFETTDDGVAGGFPNCVELPNSCSNPCWLMEDFFNSKHPYSEYRHFMIYISINEDIESMNVWEVKDLTSVGFSIWKGFDCDNPDNGEYYYHSITGDFSQTPDQKSMFSIERTGMDTWEVIVLNRSCLLRESYCEEELVTSGKGKHSYYVEKTHYPLEAQADISLKIELKKEAVTK